MTKYFNMIKRLYDPIFQADVFFATGEWSKVQKKFISFHLEDALQLAGSVTFLDTIKKGSKTRSYLIHIEDSKDFYTLLHESLHLVRHIFSDRGIPFKEDNDETIAYYQTYWFKRLWRMTND